MNRHTNISQPKYGDHYLELYGDPFTHQTMLKDTVRTKTYYNAICHNKHIFKDKVVMDVGCGTGILSLFAAKAGARLVIGVECSDIAIFAKQIVVDNKQDHVITILHCKLEEIRSLPHGIEKVDIIISEFMGVSLFWESMTETVLVARDRWLKSGGLMFPDKCNLYVVGFCDPVAKKEHFDRWNDYTITVPERKMLLNPFNSHAQNVDSSDITFDLSLIRQHALARPVVCYVYLHQCTTKPALLKSLDMYTASVEDLRYLNMPFKLETTCSGKMHGLLTYFDVEFTQCFKLEKFTTAPGKMGTHWKQMLFFFNKEMSIKEEDNMKGRIVLQKNHRYERDIDTVVEIDYRGECIYTKSFRELNLYHYHLF